MLMTEPTLEELHTEINRLKRVVKELTEALRLLTEKDERAKTFIERVEELLND